MEDIILLTELSNELPCEDEACGPGWCSPVEE